MVPTAAVITTQLDMSNDVQLDMLIDDEKQRPGFGDLRPRKLSAEELHIEAQRVLTEKKLQWDAKKNTRRLLKEKMGKTAVLDKPLSTSRNEPDAKSQSKNAARPLPASSATERKEVAPPDDDLRKTIDSLKCTGPAVPFGAALDKRGIHAYDGDTFTVKKAKVRVFASEGTGSSSFS